MPEYEYDRSGYLIPKTFSFVLKRMQKTRPFVLPTDLAKSARILFVDSGDITDLLFAAPVVNYFHDRLPDIRTTILVNAADAEVVKGIMKVNRIITYERKQLNILKADYVSLVKKLRKQFIETVIMLGSGFSLERFFLAFACGASIRIGFAHPLAFPFVNCEIRLSEQGYEGKKMPRILDAVGLGVSGELEPVCLSAKDAGHAKQLIHFRKPEKDRLTVGVDPSRGKTKHHVIPEIIAYLANNLASRRKVKFIVLMNPWDDRIAASLAKELKGEVIDLLPSGAMEAISLLSQCDLFISGNSNLFHFAAALQVPTIGLFTKYDGQRWIPDSASNVRIFKGTRGEKLSLKSFFSHVEEVLAARETVSV
jgi:ADP-heptose:LPS heptosyltransferase